MLFNSVEYIFLYLPVVFGLYFLLNRLSYQAHAKAFLALASLFFYGWWNFVYVPLILGSILFNFLFGRAIGRGGERRMALLVAGIAGNLLLLGYFKYADFFISNMNQGLGAGLPLLQVVLPLGISFFTFTQIAYLVDAYRGEAREYSFVNYSLFVTFFPHLLAGPILHHKEMMPQFEDRAKKAVDRRNVSQGLFLFFIGLFKKMAIADVFAVWANNGFDNSVSLSLIEAWATSLSYTFQIYFDFSGYTDMALGAALLFNIKLPENFNSPYKAVNIQDFWKRWHMTLSRFLRDYIYIPLGGNRASEPRVYSNLLVTFLIGGLWHGAGWTFVAWGFLHGAALVVTRAWHRAGLRMNRPLAWFLTFNFVNVTWVFFRAEDWDKAVKVLKGMAGLGGAAMPNLFLGLFPALRGLFSGVENLPFAGDGTFIGFLETGAFVSIALFISLFFRNTGELSTRELFYIFILTFAFSVQDVLFRQAPSEFLYFRF